MTSLTTVASILTTTMESLQDFQHGCIWALVVGAILAFTLGFGMGANDVSNAFGTSVGSKALGLKTAYFLATIFETLGAVLVGYNVSDTMRKFVVDINLYADQPKMLLVGQVALLGGASAWLFIATFVKLPVSTTHSVVGATLGFSIVVKGFKGIYWGKVGQIAASWVISPLLSGIVSSLLYILVDHVALRRKDPMKSALRVLPFFYFACLAFNTFAVTYQGSKVLHLASVPLWLAFVISIAVGLITGIIFHFIAGPRIVKWVNKSGDNDNNIDEINKKHENIENNQDSISTISIETFENIDPEKGNTLTEISLEQDNIEKCKNNIDITIPNTTTSTVVPNNVEHTKQKFSLHPKNFIYWLLPSKNRQEDQKTLKLFAAIQVFTACFAGFAHGANDVSNAVAPLAAIYAIYTEQSVEQKGETPIYVLLYGVLAVCIGLWILGHRVIRTVGRDMSEIHPASGFCIEFGAAVTALLASKIGLPISTTHCLVGSVVCVGTIKSGQGIDWKLFRNVALSWIVTLPVSGIISALLMLLLKLAV